jgi:3-hydroxyisobutyrate dehydrogenase-like beta-hydroxyacid dehydrogenase
MEGPLRRQPTLRRPRGLIPRAAAVEEVRVTAAESSREIGTVGFIGLGDMGGGMAGRIIAAGHPTVLWARRREALEPFAAPNVEFAATPADLAARSDVVGVCVWHDEDVLDVCTRADGVFAGCRPGTVVAIHATVLPSTCAALAAAAPAGVEVLDVPVSGGRAGAEAGTLVVAVGGDADAAARVSPVFGAFGDPVIYMGPLGSGQLAKLVNNTLLAANFALADDALALGRKFGIEPDAMAQFIRHGSGKSFALDVAVGVRASDSMRRAALAPMAKDLHALYEDPEIRALAKGTGIFAAAAEATVERLETPPSEWESAADAEAG